MRYKLFAKINKPDLENSESTLPATSTDLKVPKPKNMLLVGKANNKKLQTFVENKQKETFQYQIPRVRASLTLKVNPGNKTDIAAQNSAKKMNTNNVSHNGHQPTVVDFESLTATKTDSTKNNSATSDNSVPESKPYLPVKPKFKNFVKVLKHVPGDKSANATIPNDDKDFEIPLEESLQEVEDFIKREEEVSKWNVGEVVLAKWKGNGLFYKAEIVDILVSGLVTVVFDSYDITEQIDYKDLRKYFRKTSNYRKKGGPSKNEPQVAKKDDMPRQVKLKRKIRKPIWRSNIVHKTGDNLSKKTTIDHRKMCILKPKNDDAGNT